MGTYLERWRGTLWEYLRTNKQDLVDRLEEVRSGKSRGRNLLWWDKKILAKEDKKEKTHLWFSNEFKTYLTVIFSE